jgi:hypothetical protein
MPVFFSSLADLSQQSSSLTMGKKFEKLIDVADVVIADAGCFKYILIEVRERTNDVDQTKLVVRGDASCAYHGEISLYI